MPTPPVKVASHHCHLRVRSVCPRGGWQGLALAAALPFDAGDLMAGGDSLWWGDCSFMAWPRSAFPAGTLHEVSAPCSPRPQCEVSSHGPFDCAVPTLPQPSPAQSYLQPIVLLHPALPHLFLFLLNNCRWLECRLPAGRNVYPCFHIAQKRR